MELTFLGTGAAFAGDAFNAGYILDRRVLIDAGAPVHVLIHQTGHDIADLEAAVITHQHADHTFGLPYVMATRAIEAPDAKPFTIVGPPGVRGVRRGTAAPGLGTAALRHCLGQTAAEVRRGLAG